MILENLPIVSYNPRPELFCDELESVWIDLLLPMTRPISVGVCYRPPNQQNFLDLLEKQLCDVSLVTEIIMLGDLNIDVTNKKSNSSLVKKLFCFASMFGLTQMIDCATRITCTCSTILDLIFTSVVDNITQSGVLTVGISDHLVIYCTRKVTRAKSGCHKCVKIRSLKKYTKLQFNELLRQCGLDCIYDINNVNEAYEFFKDKFVATLNKLAPIKEVRIKQDTEPWMCSEILDLIKQRDYYLKKFKQTKSSIDLAQHHTLRNQVTQHIRKAKAHFIKDSVEENKGNPKQLWRVMQDLGCSKKCKTKETNIGINIDDSVCFDKSKVATHFNNFF